MKQTERGPRCCGGSRWTLSLSALCLYSICNSKLFVCVCVCDECFSSGGRNSDSEARNSFPLRDMGTLITSGPKQVKPKAKSFSSLCNLLLFSLTCESEHFPLRSQDSNRCDSCSSSFSEFDWYLGTSSGACREVI